MHRHVILEPFCMTLAPHLRPPPPRPKAKFAQYLFDRSLSYRDAARFLGGVSFETIRRICLAPDQPAYRRPGHNLRLKIAVWTFGEIDPDADWPEPVASRTPREVPPCP